MIEYVLVLYIYAGVLAKGDSVTMIQVPGFRSQQECMAGGEASKPLVSGSAKELRYVCLKQTKETVGKTSHRTVEEEQMLNLLQAMAIESAKLSVIGIERR